jgi:hypothetical protein
MPQYKVESPRVGGFVDKDTAAGEIARVITKNPLSTSDQPKFHLWMRQITGLFLSKIPFPTSAIEQFLVLNHASGSADVHVNDFQTLAKMRVTRDVAAGEVVSAEDVSDIAEVKFPDIEIKADDAIIYGVRTEWRFSLYFDFTRSVDPDVLATELGTLKREATFYLQRVEIDAKIARSHFSDVDAVLITEGKTDSKHLLRAARALGIQYGIGFLEHEILAGADVLYKMCEHHALMPQPTPLIFLFDRDKPEIVKKLTTRDLDEKGYQDWGNNVFSMCLPIPPGRSDETHAISIEFFYTDDALTRHNEHGRRLFLSDEFHGRTGRHLTKALHTTALNRIRGPRIAVLDSDVFNQEDVSVALSKDAFAEAISTDQEGFRDVDFSSFTPVFDTIGGIIANARSKRILNDSDWRPAPRVTFSPVSPLAVSGFVA